MDEQQQKRGAGLGRLLWILVILAIIVLWWYFRPDAETKVSLADERILI